MPKRSIALLSLFFFFLACDPDEDDEDELFGFPVSRVAIEVFLFNDDPDEAIHILAPDESFAPSNRLDPLGGREVGLNVLSNQAEAFSAGRNGEILVTVECVPVFNSSNPPIEASVIWTGDALACANWSGN